MQDLLDSQTFITFMVNNYQSYKVPDRWRNLSFSSILNMINQFSQKPLANNAGSGKPSFGQQDERA